MNEIRIAFDSNFTQTPNQVLRDPQLSLKAKGMFSLLLSHGEGYQFAADRLVKESSDKDHATKAALKELEHYKYLQRNKQPDGRMQYVLMLPNEPIVENPKVGKSQGGKIPQCENQPHKEERTLKNTDIIKNTDNTVSTPTELPTQCFTITDMLIEFVKNHTGQNKSGSRHRWARTIHKMNRLDKLDLDNIQRAVQWYINYADHDDEFCPIIRSAQSLREKWYKLVNYNKKFEKAHNQVQSTNNQLNQSLDILDQIEQMKQNNQ